MTWPADFVFTPAFLSALAAGAMVAGLVVGAFFVYLSTLRPR